MIVQDWPYVIAAYGVTWAVLLGYAFRLARLARGARPDHQAGGAR